MAWGTFLFAVNTVLCVICKGMSFSLVCVRVCTALSLTRNGLTAAAAAAADDVALSLTEPALLSRWRG